MQTHADIGFHGRRAVSLRAAQAALAGQLGPLAPSYPTLKRWAAAGRLAKAATPRGEGATRYHLDRLVKILLAIDPQRYAGLAPGTAAPAETVEEPRQRSAEAGGSQHQVLAAAAAGAPPTEIEALSRRLEQMGAELARLTSGLEARLDRIEAGVANLEATRRMLMNKTDAEVTAWRRRAESAEAQLVEAKRQAGQIDALRISRLLAQVEEHLAARTRS